MPQTIMPDSESHAAGEESYGRSSIDVEGKFVKTIFKCSLKHGVLGFDILHNTQRRMKFNKNIIIIGEFTYSK